MDRFAKLMAEFREASQSRTSHRQYYEVMLTTYHTAIMNVLINKGLATDLELLESLEEKFSEAIEKVKKLPMLSPLQ